jgi:hypothetical protein
LLFNIRIQVFAVGFILYTDRYLDSPEKQSGKCSNEMDPGGFQRCLAGKIKKEKEELSKIIGIRKSDLLTSYIVIGSPLPVPNGFQ